MDKKVIIAVGLVLVLVVAGIAIYSMANSSDNDETVEATGRLLVYGNANNDDYLDDKDLALVEQVVNGELNWDSKKDPLFDTNADGAVDAADVEVLKKILNKEDCLMYYVDYAGKASYIHYPATGAIGVVENYGMMACQTLGIYDRITAGTTWCVEESEDRYPGCSDFTVIGTGRVPDIEKVLNSGVQVIFGSIKGSVVSIQQQLIDSGARCDFIYLSFTNVGVGQSWTSSVLTMGTLLSCEDKAMEYVKYYDGMNDYIKEATKNIDGKDTYVLAYDTTNSQSTYVDTLGADGTQFGDVYCMSHLPMIDLSEHKESGYYEVSMETIMKQDPDRIFITVWSVIDDKTSPEDAQKFFEEKCEYFKGTRAYENGEIYGLCYETYGTYLGVGGLGLLASYIWPDLFDEEKGWNLLQECYSEFTLLNKNVKDCGGIQCFKMNN